MAERRAPARLDTPRDLRRRILPASPINAEGMGRASEAFARMMGTPAFLVGMTIFCAVWLSWNTLMPRSLQFDPRELNFTLLTLILSLQASYAAPLLLLAGNRQEDRDRVQVEQDRRHAEQNLADTQYLTREVASLRIALRDVATRDFVRSELRSVFEDLLEQMDHDDEEDGGADGDDPRPTGPGDATGPDAPDPGPTGPGAAEPGAEGRGERAPSAPDPSAEDRSDPARQDPVPGGSNG